MRAFEFLTESLETFADQVKNSLGLKQFILVDKSGDIELSSLIVDKAKQGEGLGTKAMRRLIDYADKHGKRIILTPGIQDSYHGTTSRDRLIRFYKQFGFKENKGRSLDFSMGAGKMFRDPQHKLDEKWSKKYKKSINCNNPRGFSQKAHCAGRKARRAGKQTKSKSIN